MVIDFIDSAQDQEIQIEGVDLKSDVYEKIIGINPGNPQYYASLAIAYVNLGRIDDAVKMARRAAQIDPSFEQDARVFIQSLGREF